MSKVCLIGLVLFASGASVLAQEAPLLTPALHGYGVYGTSSADDPADFAPGGHDPKQEEALKLQSLEPSLSLRWGDHVQGFVTGLAFTDANDDLEWEWEEYFLTLKDLPKGFELRGGRMLNRLGLHNPVHLHGWDTVDAPLPHALFLGEDGLATEGADLSIYFDTRQPTVLTIGFGNRPLHDEHAHGEEEHGADEHEDEHGDEQGDGHGHEGFGGFEEVRMRDDIVSLGLRRDHIFDDFHTVRLAAFGAMGDNEAGENAWLAGAGAEYQWRENGLEPGGRALRVRAEAIRFMGDPHGEEEHHEEREEHEEEEGHGDEEGGSVSSWGLSTRVVYEAHAHAHPFARVDYLAAADALEIDDWVRYSAGITVPFGQDPLYVLRVQGNADERGDESEQSLWLQFGFSWGGPEVR